MSEGALDDFNNAFSTLGSSTKTADRSKAVSLGTEKKYFT